MPALLLTIILIPIFWALIIRPQQRRQRAHADVVDALVVGDRVEAFSGIHGTITEVHPTTVRLEIAPGVVLTMARLAVSTVLGEEDEDDEGAGDDDGQDDDVDSKVTLADPAVDREPAATEGDLS